jgi:hypothetical protein
MSEQIETGDGWRLLGPDEAVQEGDEFINFGEWQQVFKLMIGEETTGQVRRRIPAKPEPLEIEDSNGELSTSAGTSDCSLIQDGRGELPEVIVLSGIDDIRKLGEWLISVAEWREAQGEEVSE